MLISNTIPLAWYITRATGITSFILLTILVSFGLLMSSKSLLKWRFLSIPTAFEAHHVIAFLSLGSVIIHVASLLFDKTFKLNLNELILPFQIVRPFKSALGYNLTLATGLGIIALYLMLLLIITSLLRTKLISTKIWRLIHYLGLLFYVTFLVHGFIAGTDSTEWWMRAIYIASAAYIGSLLLLRIFAKKYFMPKA
jgi:methionine sulfoxide reductase heme-binding subunit